MFHSPDVVEYRCAAVRFGGVIPGQSSFAPVIGMIVNVAPVMSRQDSRARAEEAFRLRAVGRTWTEIAAELGYGSRSAALMAVQRLQARTPPVSPDGVRRSATEGLRVMRAVLFEQFADAKVRGDNADLTVLGREIRNNISEDARLHGAHAPQRSEVDVTVSTSVTAIIDRAERDLLALAEGKPAVVDAEVIP